MSSNNKFRKSQHVGTAPRPIAHPLSMPGISCTPRGHGYEYRARAEALIEAGLALVEWLPGQPGCPNVTSLVIHVDGRAAVFLRSSSGDYRATYCYTPDERAEYDRQEEKRTAPEKARYEYAVAANKFKAAVASLPNSHEAYRASFVADDVEFSFGRFLRGIEAMITVGNAGYRYSAGSRESIAIAFATIWNELETGRIDYDPLERQRVIDGMRREIRDADPQFATMLQSIVAGANEADHG